ncbi:hypothetical protein PMAYCL1PPCAC_03861, partial [Pristionchus mayeri]|uniref:CX domain-containing protein n=1 Tax=Pristionchus mayeri TaxID=1317129 RepID=A0AAN5C9B6_9BILA
MRIPLLLLSLLALIDGKGGASGGGRGSSGARPAPPSSGTRGSSSSGSSSGSSYAYRPPPVVSRPSSANTVPRVVNTPVKQPSSSSSYRAPLIGFGAGALAGAVTANRINNARAPVHYNGNNYYWGRDAAAQEEKSEVSKDGKESTVCTRPLTNLNDSSINDVRFQNGTKPTEFAWSCTPDEQCCDWTCCPATASVAPRSASDSPDNLLQTVSTLPVAAALQSRSSSEG